MYEPITRLIADLLEAWNSRDLDRIATFYAPEYQGLDVAQAKSRQGPEEVRQTMSRYLQAFPDLNFTMEDIVIQDNRIALAWIARGRHQGKLMNIPATGREVAVRGMSLFTIEGGKIKQGCHVWDVAGLLRAIGLLPEL